MQAFSRKLVLAAALCWVAPVSAEQRQTEAETCEESHATHAIASPEHGFEATLFEPGYPALLP